MAKSSSRLKMDLTKWFVFTRNAHKTILIWKYVNKKNNVKNKYWTYITKNLICQGLGTRQQSMEKQVCSKLQLQAEQA